jgi:hypothetical protein
VSLCVFRAPLHGSDVYIAISPRTTIGQLVLLTILLYSDSELPARLEVGRIVILGSAPINFLYPKRSSFTECWLPYGGTNAAVDNSGMLRYGVYNILEVLQMDNQRK